MLADLREADIDGFIEAATGECYLSRDATLFVDTAEDTILRKLEWYRRGGETSERQWMSAFMLSTIGTEVVSLWLPPSIDWITG